MWYTSVPTVLPNTTVENDSLSSYTELTEKFSSAKGGENLLVNLIVNGYTDANMSDAAATAAYVSGPGSGRWPWSSRATPCIPR